MNIFFTSKYQYHLNDSAENVRDKLIEAIPHKPWYSFPSNNITGRFRSDGSFTLTHKWSFALITWFERDPAYLTGRITGENDRATITITLRPNSLSVFFFYIIAILLLCEVIGIKIFEGPRLLKIVFFLIFELLLFGVMQMFTTGLRKRFEKLLHLQDSE